MVIVDADVKTEILANERKLLHLNQPTVAELTELLADNFIEYGASGKTYNKQYLLEHLQKSFNTSLITIKSFAVTSLSDTVALATYTAIKYSLEGDRQSSSLRSSIWKRAADNKWRLQFHQGTLIND